MDSAATGNSGTTAGKCCINKKENCLDHLRRPINSIGYDPINENWQNYAPVRQICNKRFFHCNQAGRIKRFIHTKMIVMKRNRGWFALICNLVNQPFAITFFIFRFKRI